MIINEMNLGNYIVPDDARNGVCLEIGSNVGNFFTKYKNFFKLIHYYEPVSDTFEISKSKSCLSNNIVGFNEAAFSSTGESIEMVTHFNNESGSCSIRDGKQDWTSNVISVVNSVSIETCIDRMSQQSHTPTIDYLKMDCECCEYYFLMNKDLSNIKYIGMEIHGQLGEKNWYDLLNHISKTHSISGNTQYRSDNNSEIFCQLN